MSWQVVQHVWRIEGASITQKAVLARLADLADHSGSGIFIGQEELQRDLSCSSKTIRNVIKWAKDNGILRDAPSPGRRTKEYAFDMEVLSGQIGTTFRSNRHDVPPHEFKNRQDVPIKEESGSNRHDVPLSSGKVAPDSGQIGTTFRSNRHDVPVPYERDINKHLTNPKAEVGSNQDFGQPPLLCDDLFKVLNEVPGLARATGSKPSHIAEVVSEFPDIPPPEWIKLARACRDACLTRSQFGHNSAFAMSHAGKLREYVQSLRRDSVPSRRAATEDELPVFDPAGYQAV